MPKFGRTKKSREGTQEGQHQFLYMCKVYQKLQDKIGTCQSWENMRRGRSEHLCTLWLRQPCKHGTTPKNVPEETADTNHECRTPNNESIQKERLSLVWIVDNTPELGKAYGIMYRYPPQSGRPGTGLKSLSGIRNQEKHLEESGGSDQL